jgi:hypothetical protein
MESTSAAAPLLGRSYELPSGRRVHLRLARYRDASGVRSLLPDQSAGAGSDDVLQLVRFDPRRRMVACATELVDGRERVVGIVAIDLGADEPDVLLVDAELSAFLPELLVRLLVSRSRSIADRRAA